MYNRKFEGIWMPAALWLSRDLSITEKAVLLEVNSLDNDFGCIATNKKIGEVLELKPPTVSGILKVLEAKGYINITYKDMVTYAGRKITVMKDFTPQSKSKGIQQESIPPQEESIHSNTISNISSNLNINAELKNSADNNVDTSIVNSKKIKEKGKKKDGPVIKGFTREETIDIYSGVKNYFLEFYSKNLNSGEYYFEPKNAPKVYSILKKVLFKMHEMYPGSIFKQEDLISSTNIFISTVFKTADDFMLSNFNLSMIDSKFNDLYTKIKNKKHGNTKPESTREKTARRFGNL